MTFISPLHSLRAFVATLALGVACLLPCPGWSAEPDDEDSLELYSAFEEQPLTISRIPRPASKIAENVTVITARDIERLNAHTLADVLQQVPGIQLDYLRTPGGFTFFNLQGALNTTVLVLVDGIRQNDYFQGIAPPGLITAQQIERIEIIKGAASAAWGSALGGVINVVTKSPDPERPVAGMLSGSIGSQFTADTRAEASGTLEKFGYYLSAGNLRSDGLNPGTATNFNNLNAKFSLQLPGNGTVTAGVRHINTSLGLDQGDLPRFGGPFGDSQKIRRTNWFFKLAQPLGDDLRLEADGYATGLSDHYKSWYLADNQWYDSNNKETTRGLSTRLIWGDGQRNLVLGAEYGHVEAFFGWQGEFAGAPLGGLIYKKDWDQWAFYGNGAYTIGNLTLLPGIRYDMTGQVGDRVSYTFGTTYQLGQETTLRAYAAKGYSLPGVFIDSRKPQKVRTIQAGFETARIPYLWLKGTYFYNAMRAAESVGTTPSITDQNRQGFEVELRTVPVAGLSLAGGYTYLAAEDNDTERRLYSNSAQSVPPHTVKLKLNYDNSDLGLGAILAGSYVWWNKDPNSHLIMTNGMLWDLHLNWKLLPGRDNSPELFFSGHNLFNASQTTDLEVYQSAPRWFEGGMRVRF